MHIFPRVLTYTHCNYNAKNSFVSVKMVPSNNAQSTKCKEVFYFQQISLNIQLTLFKTPRGTFILKNCDDVGKLMEFKSKTEYSKSEKIL